MRKGEPLTVITRTFDPDVLSFVITGLAATTVYTVEVFASTRAGRGASRLADIESGVPPVRPEAPDHVAITNIGAESVLLQFEPGFDGHTSISRWIVQAQTQARVRRQVSAGDASSDSGSWHVVFETSDPDAESLTVTGLTPYTHYRLRLVAENIAGQSEPSEPTSWFETMQAAPAQPPADVTMRAVDDTQMRVTWTVSSVFLCWSAFVLCVVLACSCLCKRILCWF